MKTIFALLLAVMLALASTVQAQTARERIKADPEVSVRGSILSEVQIEMLIDEAQREAQTEARDKAAAKVKERVQAMLDADPQLRSDLANEK